MADTALLPAVIPSGNKGVLLGSLSVLRTQAAQGIEMAAANALGVSAANEGRIRYNSSTQTFQVSQNGGAWTAISTGGGVSLDGAYDFGGPGVGRTIDVDAGPVTLSGSGVTASTGLLTLTGGQTISAPGASFTWGALYSTALSITLGGLTNITTATGVNAHHFDSPTMQALNTITVTNAANVYIGGAPTVNGVELTITNSYALWVDSGNSRFDGQILASDGTVTATSYGFLSAAGRGMYTTASRLVFAIGSTAAMSLSTAIALSLGSSVSFGWTSGNAETGTLDLVLVRDAANSLGLRNGGTSGTPVPQTFNTYNWSANSNADNEYISLFFTANTAVLQTKATGTGIARALQIRYSNTNSTAIQIQASTTSGVDVWVSNNNNSASSPVGLRVGFGSTHSSVSGSPVAFTIAHTMSDAGTNSTTTPAAFSITSTINYTGATRTGAVRLAYFNPTNTSLPTGLNAAISLSSTASALGGVIYHNQSDETTNYEIVKKAWTSDVFLTQMVAAGTGTWRNIGFQIDDPAAQSLVVYNSTSTITAGVTDGYTSSLRMTPTYNAATAQTVTRHNYFDLNNPVLGGAGPAALTDACVFRYNAAPGTHKAVDSGTTKTTPGTVDAWEKRNVDGAIYFVPMYTSKTT